MILSFSQAHPFLSLLLINPNVNLDTFSASWNFLLGQVTETTRAFRTWTLRKPPTPSQLWPRCFWLTGTFPNNSQVIWFKRKFICCTKSSISTEDKPLAPPGQGSAEGNHYRKYSVLPPRPSKEALRGNSPKWPCRKLSAFLLFHMKVLWLHQEIGSQPEKRL